MNEMKKDIKSLFLYGKNTDIRTIVLLIVSTLSLEQISNLEKSFEKLSYMVYTFTDGRDDKYMMVKNISRDMFRFLIKQGDYDIESYIFCQTNNTNKKYPKMAFVKKYNGPLAITLKASWMEVQEVKARNFSIINTFFTNVKSLTDIKLTPIEFFSSLKEMSKCPVIEISKGKIVCR